MRIFAMEVTESGQLKPCDAAHALAGARAGSGTFWIRMGHYQKEELETWLQDLPLSPFARTRLLNQGEITKVVPLDNGIVMELRVWPVVEPTVLKQISLLCLEHLVVDLDAGVGGSLAVLESPGEGFELTDPSATGILMSVLLQEAKRIGLESRAIRSAVFQLDERMDRDPGGVALDDILDAKDRLLRLLSVAEEQLECFHEFTAFEHASLDFSRLQGTVHLLLSEAGCSDRMAERLEKRVADLRQRYEAHQQEKLNHRLAVLTMVSAVFLPLSLIAGIWGMNFNRMPELAQPLGYPAALAFMTCIAGGMLWFFRRKGWFE